MHMHGRAYRAPHTRLATSSNSERAEEKGVGGDRPKGLADARHCDEEEEEKEEGFTSSTTGDAARARSVEVGLRRAEHDGVSATKVGDWVSSAAASVGGSARFRLAGDVKSSAVCRTVEPTSSSSWASSPAIAAEPSSCTSARLVHVDDLLLWVVAVLKICMRLVNLRSVSVPLPRTLRPQSACRLPQQTSALHGKRAV